MNTKTENEATLYRYTDEISGLRLHVAIFQGAVVDMAEIENLLRPLEPLGDPWVFDINTPMSVDERVRISDDKADRGWTILGSEHPID